MKYKIHDVLKKNEDGYGNGVGELIAIVHNYEHIQDVMNDCRLNQAFVIDEDDLINTFYIEDFEMV